MHKQLENALFSFFFPGSQIGDFGKHRFFLDLSLFVHE